MKFENTDVWGFSHAIRGMRNPLASWEKSDSFYLGPQSGAMIADMHIGENDLALMQRLIRAGGCHRKFMRQIMVSVDITAPLYWWKEFDTYKVGTTANSESTMHRIASFPITRDCFEHDDEQNLDVVAFGLIGIHLNDVKDGIVEVLEALRKAYVQTKDKRYWKELIRLLPESWLQMRTVTMSYENLFAICSKDQRRNHKLNEWSGADDPSCPNFIAWARSLPYAQVLIFIDESSENGGDGCGGS